LAITDAQNVPELFTVAARYGDLDDARYALRDFEGCAYPERRYLQAHRLLARAYLAFRTAQYSLCSESAGDAARAFSAMGLRRWTDEAMALLVRHGGGGWRPRGKLRSALTQREEQIANLIRRGARNREIASTLQISEHTVERHVSSILGRLGLRSRWQIADTRAERAD
ncbi:MAG: response regulator transcription factor, partial [Candidatus Eremiobacteraeota bacterium]|nr:response regulator transcription factor [Candidatus Eremiobacteraeota bacterium]